MEQEHQFIDYIEQSIIKNWDKDALTDYKGITLQYKDVARKIAKFHIVLESAGIQPGDKIAVCGRNSAHWAVTFLATITYGAVIVPILHEFKADNIHNIVNHSEAKLLFVGDQAWENLNEDAMPLLEGIASLADFSALVSRNEKLTYAFEHRNAIYGQQYPKNFRPEHICYRKDRPEELAIINYTSGTTGYSKGVMLPYRSLWSNVAYCFEMLPVKPGDHIVSMLPMGHVFGMVYDFLYGFSAGAHIYFLTRMPSPKIISQSFSEIKPKVISCVPLIVEKIIKKDILGNLVIEEKGRTTQTVKKDFSGNTVFEDEKGYKKTIKKNLSGNIIIEDDKGNTETIKKDIFGNIIIEDERGNKKTIKKDLSGKFTIEDSHGNKKTIRKDIFDNIIIEDY